jgi:hypothetical protein
VSVLLKICLKSKNNFFVYNKETTAFPEEKEVLLQEGLEFFIGKKTKETHPEAWDYYEVNLILK